MIRLIFHGDPDSGAKFQLHPHARLALLDDNTSRQIHFGGRFEALSETATAILREHLTGPREIAESMLANRYGVSREQIATDAEDFLGGLLADGMLQPASQTNTIFAPVLPEQDAIRDDNSTIICWHSIRIRPRPTPENPMECRWQGFCAGRAHISQISQL